MVVRMRTRYAGPRGNAGPGETIDIPRTEAQALIDGRYAVRADGEKPPVPQKAAVKK